MPKLAYGQGIPPWSVYHRRKDGWNHPAASSMSEYGSYTKPGAVGADGATPAEQARQARNLLKNMKTRGTTDHTWGQLGGEHPDIVVARARKSRDIKEKAKRAHELKLASLIAQ